MKKRAPLMHQHPEVTLAEQTYINETKLTDHPRLEANGSVTRVEIWQPTPYSYQQLQNKY